MEQTIIKYARRCDVTQEGMNEGYCILDGLMYIKHESDMIKHIKDETDYNDIEEAYEDDYYYFTDWFDDEYTEDEWYTEDGDLMAECFKCHEEVNHDGTLCPKCLTSL